MVRAFLVISGLSSLFLSHHTSNHSLALFSALENRRRADDMINITRYLPLFTADVASVACVVVPFFSVRHAADVGFCAKGIIKNSNARCATIHEQSALKTSDCEHTWETGPELLSIVKHTAGHYHYVRPASPIGCALVCRRRPLFRIPLRT